MHPHTFVIPAYKNSEYLEACIVSLISQTTASNILITTSTPDSYIENLAVKYRLPYYVNFGEKGIAADWNFAVEKSPTDLVTIAHQDDIYHKEYVSEILKIIEPIDHKVQIVFSNYSDISNGKTTSYTINSIVKQILLLPFAIKKIIGNRFLKQAILSLGDPICCPSVTLNKKAVGNAFKFDTGYSCALDWLAWLQLAKENGLFVYINKKLVQHRIHLESETTNQINNGQRQFEEHQIYTMIWGAHIAKLITKLYSVAHKQNELPKN